MILSRMKRVLVASILLAFLSMSGSLEREALAMSPGGLASSLTWMGRPAAATSMAAKKRRGVYRYCRRHKRRHWFPPRMSVLNALYRQFRGARAPKGVRVDWGTVCAEHRRFHIVKHEGGCYEALCSAGEVVDVSAADEVKHDAAPARTQLPASDESITDMPPLTIPACELPTSKRGSGRKLKARAGDKSVAQTRGARQTGIAKLRWFPCGGSGFHIRMKLG